MSNDKYLSRIACTKNHTNTNSRAEVANPGAENINLTLDSYSC